MTDERMNPWMYEVRSGIDATHSVVPGASKLMGIFRKMALAPKLNKIQPI